MTLTETEFERLTDAVAANLSARDVAGADEYVLSKRRLMSLVASGVLSVGALSALTQPAEAAAVGTIGSSSNRVDLFGETINATGYTLQGSNVVIDVPDSGEVPLSSGSATVATGVTATDATFLPALGVDDPGSDVTGLAAQLDLDSASGEYEVTISETDSSQNPTVNYDLLRVR
jgi:hypothetical protein